MHCLRHAVVNCSDDDVQHIFNGVPVVPDSRAALDEGQFAGVFDFADKIMHHADGYSIHPENSNICYKHSDSLPPPGIDEQWRNVYADVTSPGIPVNDEQFTSTLATWLVDNQPITLAVNDDGNDPDYKMAMQLFEQTGQVVYTVGTNTTPALTCQARPQDGEVFGEFPVRKELKKYTKFPVVVPTPTPAYNSVFTEAHLQTEGAKDTSSTSATFQGLQSAVSSPEMKGYLRVIYDYLADVCQENPKVGHNQDNRTALFGLQTTPHNGSMNFIRAKAGTSVDDVAPFLLPFHTTNSDSVVVSVDPADQQLAEKLRDLGVLVVVESDSAFDTSVEEGKAFNIIHAHPSVSDFEYSLPGQFVSQYLCVGHIKSVKPNDQKFIEKFTTSKKWLAMK